MYLSELYTTHLYTIINIRLMYCTCTVDKYYITLKDKLLNEAITPDEDEGSITVLMVRLVSD